MIDLVRILGQRQAVMRLQFFAKSTISANVTVALDDLCPQL